MNTMLSQLGEARAALYPFAYGKDHVINLLLIALLTRGHILLEDVPGVGKTTLAKAFSKMLGRTFSRLQGTSDTLPQDITGGEILNLTSNAIEMRFGPLFQEIVLIDEINRMHPKSQSALLEAMEEKKVSLAGTSYALPKIHMVLATQNPIEYNGTYPLPEAQRDRFLCFISIGFPERELQKQIIQHQTYLQLDEQIAALPELFSESDILQLQEHIKSVHIGEEILNSIMNLVDWSRNTDQFRYGISPRGIALFSSALRAQSLISGRNFVIPEDARHLFIPLLFHRIEFLDEALTLEQKKQLLQDAGERFFG